MTDTSVLVLTGVGTPPYSVRGATQSLKPISGSTELRRTVNGALEDLSASEMRKYQTTISCTDQQPPAFAGMWPGNLLVVDCISELAVALDHVSEAVTEGSTEDLTTIESLLEREAVPGSLRIEDGFVIFRPRLHMRVTGFAVDRNEYTASNGWSVDLEEV